MLKHRGQLACSQSPLGMIVVHEFSNASENADETPIPLQERQFLAASNANAVDLLRNASTSPIPRVHRAVCRFTRRAARRLANCGAAPSARSRRRKADR